jgi:uncharacterized protein VirK/YbjX
MLLRKTLQAGQYIYPSNTCAGILGQLKFIKNALKHRALLRAFVQEIHHLGYSAIFDHDIPVLGALEWPYIHKGWEAPQRFATITWHYQLLKTLPEVFNVSDGQPKKIIDLEAYSAGASIVLDKAKWFVREGEIVLNLFKDDSRMMSLAFTFAELDGVLVMYVGAIQGIHADDQSLVNIKAMTKDFEGLRPRDLLIEVLRMIAQKIGVKTILGINDEDRHHRHRFFRGHESKLKSSYNDIWLEQQAVISGDGFYALPIVKPRKDLAEIDSKKRAMYRRRYEMLDYMDATIKNITQWSSAEVAQRSDCKDHVIEDRFDLQLGR